VRFILPELKENNDKIEVRKALIDAEKQINEKNDSQDSTILSNTTKITTNTSDILALYNLFPNIPTRTITANYTLQADDVLILVNTNNAITITVPTGLKVGRGFTVKRVSSGLTANGITLSFGTNTIYGATSIVIFGNSIAKTSKYTEQYSFLQTTSTAWELVAGEDAGSNANGSYKKRIDQHIEQWGRIVQSVTGLSGETNNFGSTSGTIYTVNYLDAYTFPAPFTTQPIVTSNLDKPDMGWIISRTKYVSANYLSKFSVQYMSPTNTNKNIEIQWQAIGKWIN